MRARRSNGRWWRGAEEALPPPGGPELRLLGQAREFLFGGGKEARGEKRGADGVGGTGAQPVAADAATPLGLEGEMGVDGAKRSALEDAEVAEPAMLDPLDRHLAPAQLEALEAGRGVIADRSVLAQTLGDLVLGQPRRLVEALRIGECRPNRLDRSLEMPDEGALVFPAQFAMVRWLLQV